MNKLLLIVCGKLQVRIFSKKLRKHESVTTWSRICWVINDGGKNVCGMEKDLVSQIYKTCKDLRCWKPMVVLWNQQVPCRTYLNLSCVIEPLVSTVNFIHSHRLNHCSSMNFCQNWMMNTLICPNT